MSINRTSHPKNSRECESQQLIRGDIVNYQMLNDGKWVDASDGMKLGNENSTERGKYLHWLAELRAGKPEGLDRSESVGASKPVPVKC